MKKVKLIRPIINCSYNAKNSFYQIFTTCYAQNSPKINCPQNLKILTSVNVTRLITILNKLTRIKKPHIYTYNRSKFMAHYFGEVKKCKFNKEFSRMKDKRVSISSFSK